MISRFLPLCFSALIAAVPLQAAADASEGTGAIEFPEESSALIAATLAFFDKVEAHRPAREQAPVVGIPLAITKSSVSIGSDDTDLLTRMGPVDHLTGYRISWYPVDKLYGSVDFMGTWNGNRNLVCGYLTWDLSNPDAPELETVSASFVDIATLATASASDIHESLLEANCAHGAIEANYRMFDVSG